VPLHDQGTMEVITMSFLNKLQIWLSFVYLEYSQILGPTKWFQNQIQLKQIGKTTQTKTNYKLRYWSGVHSTVVSNIYITSLFQDMNSTTVVARGMKTQWTESQCS